MFYVLKLEHEELGEESTQKDQTRMFLTHFFLSRA
jgi:hypothetical protein